MQRGFTLVELLVVIAIVLLLLALVTPVMRSVRASAKRVTCASNMRQLYLGFQMYANENSNHVPFVDPSTWGGTSPGMRRGHVDWIGYWVGVRDIPRGGTLWPFIENAEVYMCPEDTGWRGDFHIWTPKPGVHSYAVPVPRECTLLSTRNAGKALLVDESETTINDGGFVTTWDALASRHRISGWGKRTRSSAGGNILFCDGRVEFYLSSEMLVANDPMFR